MRMPRLNASQSQSYVLGGDKGGSDLPRFERPVLKQAKSAYTTTTSPRVPPKSSLSTGFFGGRNGANGAGLPLTNSPSSGNRGENSSSSSSKPRNKVRAAVPGREGVLPDWSRTAPSPSNSFNQNYHHHHSSPSNSRVRTTSQDVYPQHLHTPGMSSSLRELSGHSRTDYDSDEDYHHHVKQRRSSTSIPPSHHHQAGHMHPMHHDQHPHHQHQSHESSTSSRVLRQRKGYMEELASPHQQGRPPKQPNRATSGSSSQGGTGGGSASNSPHFGGSKRRSGLIRLDSKLRQCQRWSLSQVLQGAVFLLVTFLLYDGHHKANLIANRLKEFKSEEAMLFLHLHRIEQQSIQLHEALQRLDTPSNNNNKIDPPSKNNDGEYLQDPRHNGGGGQHPPNIDSALIQKQTQQLMQMEEELSHEVRTLQTRIQHSAVRSIVHEYGEGPVQVIWEVVVDGQTSKISILLWHDTPHAAWTWLEQISRKLWDGAQVHLENNRILGIGSTHTEVSHDARLDFIERSQQRHEAWTVGLSDATHDSTASQHEGNGLQVFINLLDNTEFSKHNVCIGKVFDGFDVLHKMVEQTRQMQQVAGGQAPPQPITIKTARASHLTNRETKGLI